MEFVEKTFPEFYNLLLNRLKLFFSFYFCFILLLFSIAGREFKTIFNFRQVIFIPRNKSVKNNR